MMPTEPHWPTIDEVQTEVGRRVAATGQALLQTPVAIEMCRAAWLAANDDPSADLPGTVRISPDERLTAILTSDDDSLPWAIVIHGGGREEKGYRGHSSVVGWTRGTPVEGTPAAKAAGQ